jgi:hypothetical protein
MILGSECGHVEMEAGRRWLYIPLALVEGRSWEDGERCSSEHREGI